MPRKLSDAISARIAALRTDENRTDRQIVTILGREGTQITASGVHRVLSRLGLAAARKAPASKKSPVAGRVEPAAPPPSEPRLDDLDVPARMHRVLSSLERVAMQAEADKDVARVVACQRAITQATALLAKATPPPAPNVDAHPDMVAAAKRGRDHMHIVLDRLLGVAS